jgi:hypothetical protein
VANGDSGWWVVVRLSMNVKERRRMKKRKKEEDEAGIRFEEE